MKRRHGGTAKLEKEKIGPPNLGLSYIMFPERVQAVSKKETSRRQKPCKRIVLHCLQNILNLTPLKTDYDPPMNT